VFYLIKKFYRYKLKKKKRYEPKKLGTMNLVLVLTRKWSKKSVITFRDNTNCFFCNE
jgi:sugar (pentulose or hexulose) kinase